MAVVEENHVDQSHSSNHCVVHSMEILRELQAVAATADLPSLVDETLVENLVVVVAAVEQAYVAY